MAALERRTHDVLDAAYEAGVRYFDAARSYGLAEQFLASWLASRGIAPGDVASGRSGATSTPRAGRSTPTRPRSRTCRSATFRRQVHETMELLGEHLTLYQIHSATLDSGVLDDEELLEELADLARRRRRRRA